MECEKESQIPMLTFLAFPTSEQLLLLTLVSKMMIFSSSIQVLVSTTAAVPDLAIASHRTFCKNPSHLLVLIIGMWVMLPQDGTGQFTRFVFIPSYIYGYDPTPRVWKELKCYYLNLPKGR